MVDDELLTPAEVASILYVDPKTVTRWAIAGKVTAVRTPGGHRRFLKAEILALRRGQGPPAGRTSVPVGPATLAAGTAVSREARGDVVVADLAVVAEAAAAAADRVAEAAAQARRHRSRAASLAAAAVADDAARNAAIVQCRAEAVALSMTEAASLAAEVVAAAGLPGNERSDAVTARRVDVLVKAAAVTAAEETAGAALRIAATVAAAAVEVAFVVSAADLAIEREVARTAATVHAVASAAARQMVAVTEQDHRSRTGRA